MNKLFSIITAACLLLQFASPSRADFEKTKLAVLDFQLKGNVGNSLDMGAIVAEWFITYLVKTGRFEVVERGLLNKIIDEQKLSMSGFIDEDSASKLGRLLGVKVIISGSVLKYDNTMEVNARIIDVESASIITAENVRGGSATNLEDLVARMSDRIIKDFPLVGYIVDRKEEKVVIDLGKHAGVKPGMKFVVFKEGDVIKHPKTGEVLTIEKIETGAIRVTEVKEKISEAEIEEEYDSEKIVYGQRIKSIQEEIAAEMPSETVYQQAVQYQPTTQTEQKQVEAPPAKELPPEAANYIKMLKSKNPVVIRDAAKKIIRSRFSRDEEVLDVVNEVLLDGYMEKSRDNMHVDAMAWLCRVLKASYLQKYTETLQLVGRKAPSKKLRKYAK